MENIWILEIINCAKLYLLSMKDGQLLIVSVSYFSKRRDYTKMPECKKVIGFVHCWISFLLKRKFKTKDAPKTSSSPLAWNHYMSYGKNANEKENCVHAFP